MPVTTSSIVDNRGDNTLLTAIAKMGQGGRELWIATAFFSLDALRLLSACLSGYQRVRILFGDDASARQREQLLQRLRQVSEPDLLAEREHAPLLGDLGRVQRLFDEGRIEARCYTALKFHAKAYLIDRDEYPERVGLLGSGNFTRPGLLQNVELNAILTPEQTEQLRVWYEERWDEAQEDDVTGDVLDEIRRHLDLYDPYWLYLKALYLWGDDRRGQGQDGSLPILPRLDEHQKQGFWQAQTILAREHGVMICDGVGLGKSYIALALMQQYCREGKRVLLLAPKNILTNSWDGYLEEHLTDYREPFGSIDFRAMTELGFDPDDLDGDELSEAQRRNARLLEGWADRADLVVIDESHNFRTRTANRYRNLFRLLEQRRDCRKDVVLLTATPINTQFEDVSNQLELITHEQGRLAGYPAERIRSAAREADRTLDPAAVAQLSLAFDPSGSELLQNVFEQVMIQRSRTTCKALSAAAGKTLHFPVRRDPECVKVALDHADTVWLNLIEKTDRGFRPGVDLLRRIRDAKDDHEAARIASRGASGIKLSAFLTEQYRWQPQTGSKVYHDEIHLAGLVYANTLKQLESSPAAFQGILQSLALGLLARLQVVFGDDAADLIADHRRWVNQPLMTVDSEVLDPDTLDDGDALDLAGEEQDVWLAQAVRGRKLETKLSDFTADSFDIVRWRRDIESDLNYLREIHEACVSARQHPDPKLEQVLPRLEALLADGRRVLVFTQSQRTAEYLEDQLGRRLPARPVARIDSRVEKTRPSIIHAFCPNYNPRPWPWSPSVPERIELLVSTDVLSEGVNLQEAGAIVNYDVHWNPVRLIQRIGRVDRRLDPRLTPADHDFHIVNVLPPDEIETVLQLVATIEDRQLKISRALGLDQSFFRADDPAGTLREFNRLYEGTPTPRDDADAAFTERIRAPDAKAVSARLDALPRGAFGVWSGAPDDGLFALFTMTTTGTVSEADRERFGALVGRPVLALQRGSEPLLFDAGEILKLLADIPPDQRSGVPSDETALAAGLKRLRAGVRQSFAELELPQTFRPELVCWLELRQGTPR